jgi:hypothetical protein
MADKVADGTLVHGERNVHARLTETDVRLIRESSDPAPVLAARFGVGAKHILGIRAGYSWKHVR